MSAAGVVGMMTPFVLLAVAFLLVAWHRSGAALRRRRREVVRIDDAEHVRLTDWVAELREQSVGGRQGVID